MSTLFKNIGLTCMALAVLLLAGGGFLNIQKSATSATVVASTLVQNTNEARAETKLGVLTHSAVLDRAATLKANDMMQNKYFAHRSPSGVTPWYWFKEVNYSYLRAGENLAVHFTDSAELLDAWLNSPSHRANIMNKAYTEIGIGMATGTFEGVQTTFVVQLFGTPMPVIKQGAVVGMFDKNEFRVISDTSDTEAYEHASTERVSTTYKSEYVPVSVLIFMIGAFCLMLHVCINCMLKSCVRVSLYVLAATMMLAMAVMLLIRTMFFGVI